MATYDEFKGILPYASELVGVYQPLLGWKSRQTKDRVDREKLSFIKEFIEKISFDSRIWEDVKSKPEVKDLGYVDPLPPDLLNTEVSKYVQSAAINLLKQKKRLPTKDEWKSITSERELEKAWRSTNSIPGGKTLKSLDLVFFPKNKLTPTESRNINAYPVSGTKLMVAKAITINNGIDTGNNIELSIDSAQESVAASVFRWLGRHEPDILTSLFLVRKSSWEISKDYIDPISHFESESEIPLAVLAPIGLLHLYRQYFFEFETFLGTPVGHVWITPGGTVELIEVSTRRILTERSIESLVDTLTKTEKTSLEQDDLADAVKEDNENNTKIGASASGGGGVAGVWHAEGSAEFGLDNSNKLAQETTHKHMRQQSEKLSSEIRHNFRTTFRTTTETTDTSSRRSVVMNNTNKLVNYELRRKMRKVGVQVQHLATQLCWQAYVDEPGYYIGIAQLVHIAKAADANSNPQPEAPAVLDGKTTDYVVSFAFEATSKAEWRTATYVKGKFESDKSIVWQRKYSVVPPSVGYILGEVQVVSFKGSDPQRWDPKVSFSVKTTSATEFQISLDSVDFEDNPAIDFTLRLIWSPPDQTAALEDYKTKMKDQTQQKQRDAKLEYVQAVRDRIELASNVRSRPSDELREEERVVIYRRLIRQLMQIGEGQNAHVMAELIRQMFDVDRMLYFVAPDWWMPRMHAEQQFFGGIASNATSDSTGSSNTATTATEVKHLTEDRAIGWGGTDEIGRNNYLITEESQPARMGSSIGWLLQLDGDNRRNAFLNSPWVKAVIPIHPGKEMEALKFLELAHVEGTDGLDATYGGPEPEFKGKSIEDVLKKLAEKLKKENTNINNVVKTETLYEKGFDPLQGGFRATGTPYEIFDQWIEVLPTDQVVAVEYETK